MSTHRLKVRQLRRPVTTHGDQHRAHRALVRGFSAANRCLTSAVAAHDLAVSRYRDEVTSHDVRVTRFDRVVRSFGTQVHSFGTQVWPQGLEVN